MPESQTSQTKPSTETRRRLEALAEGAWAQRDSDPVATQELAERMFAASAHTPYGRALSLIIQSLLAFREARYDVALERAFGAQLILGDDALPVWQARLFNTLGCIYLSIGEHPLGLEQLHKLLAYAQANGLSAEIFMAYHDLGVYFSMVDEPARALECFDKASHCLPPELSGRAFLELNLARHYAGQAQFEKATAHAEIGLALSRNNPGVHRFAFKALAEIAIRQDDHSEALRVYGELLEFDQEHRFPMGETLLQLGESQLALGKTQAALGSLHQAFEYVGQRGSKLHLSKCHELLSEAYKCSGDFEKALEHHERFHTHHEAMFNESSATKVRALEVMHHMDTLKQESELLKQKNIELEHHNRALQELHEKVHELSIRDPLTGLYNRRHLLEQLADTVKLAQRYGHPLSVAMLDIDHFKAINDTFGHKLGDAVLERVGELLRTILRETDLTARYGGEEFALIMSNTALEDAAGACERLRQQIGRYDWNTLHPALKVTVSIGVATLNSLEVSEKDDLFARADAQLYLAKRSGRNRIRF